MDTNHQAKDPKLDQDYLIIFKRFKMKKFKQYIIITTAFMLIGTITYAQVINWGSLEKENRHTINLKVGMEHGTVFGIGYGYSIQNKWFPLMLNAEYSFPSGTELFDDFKTKIGAQVRWFQLGDVQFSTGIHGVFRRYENDLVRIVNFGSDFSAVAGYYRNNWFAAAQAGFDKAIVSHFKHTDAYKDQYPGVQNGWYEPSVGGNFYYGVLSGYSFKKHDIYLKAGKMISQDWKTKPVIPFYGEVGYNINF